MQLARYLLTALAERPGQPLNILEVGPGNISILLQSIVDCSKMMDVNAEKEVIRIWFVDPLVPEKHEKISSTDGGLSFLTDKNQFEYAENLEAINLEARLIKREFNKFLSEDMSGAAYTSSAQEFDFIIMHTVLHELFISAKEAADKYFPRLFHNLHTLLSNEGILLFADYYYPPYHGTIESHSFIEDLTKDSQHANAPVAFLHPEYLLTLLFKREKQKHKMHFKLLADEEAFIRYKKESNIEKGRKFYFIVLQKAGESR